MKTFIQIAVFLVCITHNLIGQKDCNKNIHFAQDEYTNKSRVFSEQIKVMDKTGKHILTELVNSNDKIVDWDLRMGFIQQSDAYILSFTHYSYGQIPTQVNEVDIKFDDESVLLLTDSRKSDEIETGPNTSFIISFFDISEEDLKMLTSKGIKKIRAFFEFQPREPSSETELSEKISDLARNLAICFQDLAPKPKPKALVENKIVEKKNTENSNSFKDPSTLSFYKRWKLIAVLGNEGTPQALDYTEIVQLNEDGTFEITHVYEKNETEIVKGRFQLLNENKLILLTTDGGKTSTAVISRITQTEFEIKDSKNTSFYIMD